MPRSTQILGKGLDNFKFEVAHGVRICLEE